MVAAVRQPALERLRAQLAATRPTEREQPAGGARWSPAALAGRLVELSGAAGAGTLTWAVALAAAVQRTGRPVAWVMPAAGGLYPPDAAAHGVRLDALAIVRVPGALQTDTPPPAPSPLGREGRTTPSHGHASPSPWERGSPAPAGRGEAAPAPPRLPSPVLALGRAAERLARSGGFGLVVLELGPCRALPAALQGLLSQHALRHGSIVLCLTDKPERSPSLGSLVSLRAVATRRRVAPGEAGDGEAGNGEPGAGFRCALRAVKDKRGGPGWEEELACHGPPGLR
jgi:recombination protein RecA